MTALCCDCGVDTAPMSKNGKFRKKDMGKWESYMVYDAVWAASGMPCDPTGPHANGEGFLCIGCLEQRLERGVVEVAHRCAQYGDIPVDGPGAALYRAVVEGIVAKCLADAYHPKLARWHKVINRTYSQRHRRAEWFRERHGRYAGHWLTAPDVRG